MSEYIFILLWTGLAGAVIGKLQCYRREPVISGGFEYRVRPVAAILLIAPLIWMTATRANIGDTGNYYSLFKEMPSRISDIPAFLGNRVGKDYGFYLLSCLLKVLFGGSRMAYFLPIALMQGLAIMYFFRKYTRDYALAIFLFIASADYISWMYNGIRQFMAVILLLLATNLMIKKKYMALLAVILLASTMHQSVLLMIPLVLIAQGRAWNTKTVLFLTGVIVIMLFVDQFTDVLDYMMQDTQYANVVSDWIEWKDDGTNPLRVLVYSVPTILSLVGLRYIREANDPLINLCTNMSIFTTGMYLVSMVTSGIFLGRLPIYSSLYSYVLLLWECRYMFTEASAGIVRLLMIGAYLLFYVYQMHVTYAFF